MWFQLKRLITLARRYFLCVGYTYINILKIAICLKVKGDYVFIATLNWRIRAL